MIESDTKSQFAISAVSKSVRGTLSMADADDATNELIARILAGDAEQDAYAASFDEIGNGDCSDDSDFGQPTRKRAKTGFICPCYLFTHDM